MIGKLLLENTTKKRLLGFLEQKKLGFDLKAEENMLIFTEIVDVALS